MSQSVERREKLRTSEDLIINGTRFGKDKYGRRWTRGERERERCGGRDLFLSANRFCRSGLKPRFSRSPGTSIDYMRRKREERPSSALNRSSALHSEHHSVRVSCTLAEHV